MLKISPKHGFNPSVDRCYFCNEDKGVVLLGLLPGDAEAPRQAVYSREPCDKCAEYMKQGVILISIDETRSDPQQPNNPWRSGGWVVMADKYIKRAIHPQQLRDLLLKTRFAFVPDQVWDMLGLPRSKYDELRRTKEDDRSKPN